MDYNLSLFFFWFNITKFFLILEINIDKLVIEINYYRKFIICEFNIEEFNSFNIEVIKVTSFVILFIKITMNSIQISY